MDEEDTLLRENLVTLEALADTIEGHKKLDIDVGAIFADRETALAARLQMKEEFVSANPEMEKPIVAISRVDDESGEYSSSISLYLKPDAAVITKAELIVRRVAEELGGREPGWDIIVPKNVRLGVKKATIN